LLVEPQRTNLLNYSSSFDNAAWTKNNSTATANATTSPSGIQDADLITSTSTNETGVFYLPSVSGTNTWSIYAKKGTGRYLFLNTNNPPNIAAKFDLQDGVIVGTPAVGATASIEDAGNGWYRCIITSSTSTNRFTAFITNNTTTENLSSNVGLTYYLWGAQLEVGSYATSYIPTTSTSVTRNADVVSKTGITSLIGQTEGTVFYEGSKIGLDNSEFYISDGTYNNFIRFQYYLEFDIIFVVLYNNGATQGFLTTSAYTVSDNLKIAIKYKTNDFALWVNGTEVATDTSGTTFAANTLNRINLGQPDNNAAGVFKGNVKALSLWKTALTNTQLAELTTL
jgi:hypothetical protein